MDHEDIFIDSNGFGDDRYGVSLCRLVEDDVVWNRLSVQIQSDGAKEDTEFTLKLPFEQNAKFNEQPIAMISN